MKNKSNIVPNLSNKKTANSQVDEKNSGLYCLVGVVTFKMHTY